MKKLLLIDGNSIMNRAFYGVPVLTNSKGVYTNAVYGFLNIIFKIAEEEKPDNMMVAFDVHEPTFRHKMFKEYKGTRKGMPEELKEQMPLIREMLSKMNISIVQKGGYEADDILGTIAKDAESKGYKVSIISGDRDMLQLSTENILIRIPKTGRGGTVVEDYYPENVQEKYGITPAQVIDMKALMGDSSDNIPGVPGVGEKTALSLLKDYPTLDEVYAHLEDITKARTKKLLEENKELAYLSKDLATIEVHADIEYDLERADFVNIFTKDAFIMMNELELNSLIKRFRDRFNVEGNVEGEVLSVSGEAEKITPSDYEIIKDLAAFKKAEKDIKNHVKKAEFKTASIALMGDEWSSDYAKVKKSLKGKQMTFEFLMEEAGEHNEYDFYGVSLSLELGENIKTYIIEFNAGFEDYEAVLNILKEVFNKAEKIVVPDAKNALHLLTSDDKLFMEDELIKNSDKIYDISLMGYLMNPLSDGYSVASVINSVSGIIIDDFKALFDKKKNISEVFNDETLADKLDEYMLNEAFYSLIAGKKLWEKIEEYGLKSLYKDVEIKTAYYLYIMERNGVMADKEELNRMSTLFGETIAELEKDIYTLAGEEFNINSPKQLGVILFEKMNLPFAKKTKTGYSTAADVLEKLIDVDPIVPKILEYRQVSKLKSTYADGLQPYIGNDNRIHGKFNQTITATGRLSSTDPNLQNIPVRMELGRRLRAVFKPKPGCTFVDADYSQIELRLLAHMSGDRELIESYKIGKDIHAITASKVFNVPFEEVTKEQRRNAKAVNFGIIYGMSSFGLSQDLNISAKQAKEYIDQYFKTYPDIKAFLDKLISDAKEKGYSTTIYGRRRPIPELNAAKHMQKAFGERVAMNSPIQGSAADIIKIAMVKVARALREEGLRSQLVLQVHDELLIEAYDDEVEKVKEILEREMTNAADLSVKLEVEVSTGSNWYEAH
ncbi:MAG: DNA polymerase I [Lachnospiraceae bacterium]|nr:DNA polymerase I [Lachnospiraceae bacterium]